MTAATNIAISKFTFDFWSSGIQIGHTARETGEYIRGQAQPIDVAVSGAALAIGWGQASNTILNNFQETRATAYLNKAGVAVAATSLVLDLTKMGQQIDKSDGSFQVNTMLSALSSVVAIGAVVTVGGPLAVVLEIGRAHV